MKVFLCGRPMELIVLLRQEIMFDLCLAVHGKKSAHQKQGQFPKCSIALFEKRIHACIDGYIICFCSSGQTDHHKINGVCMQSRLIV